jgi:site-specific DNA-methyltransferase (adenine-specific)
MWEVLRPLCGEVPPWIDQLVERIEAEREVVGKRNVPSGHAFAGATYGNDSTEKVVDVTTPATDAARTWQGWGTALKPAWEPVVLARKPLVGTVAASVLAHGTGAINVDGCRIGFASEKDRKIALPGSMPKASASIGTFQTRDRTAERPEDRQSPLGRWPANVVLDEEAAAMLDAQTDGKLHSAGRSRSGSSNAREVIHKSPTSWSVPGNTGKMFRIGDSGGASRFFYTAKASRRERGEGNTHPTVKPLALMRWLCRLVCPPGGTILDPFAGSGTTGIAAHLEGFDATLVEKQAEYIAIIEGRFSTLTTNPDSDEDK